MDRISRIRRAAWPRLQESWRNLPRPQWNVQRVILMVARFVLTGAVLWHCEGNVWVFCFGTVMAGQTAGAAAGVPFRRIPQCALCGSILGLLFFAYACPHLTVAHDPPCTNRMPQPIRHLSRIFGTWALEPSSLTEWRRAAEILVQICQFEKLVRIASLRQNFN